MKQSVPFLKIIAPDGSEQVVSLERTCYTIGRIPELNDIALMDLDGVITRKSHCLLKKVDSTWWIVDQSTNGTILTRKKDEIQLQDLQTPEIELFSGDCIIIHNWQLIFNDLSQSLYNTTKNLKKLVFKSKYQTPFVFNVSELNLYQIQAEGKLIVQGLRPKARDLLTYMAQQNLDNGNQATICSYEDIKHSLWEENERYGVGNEDIYTLVKEIRKHFKAVAKEYQLEDQSTQWLETIKKIGLRLNIDCEF